ncbi:MAG: hypothetical protein BWZ02_03123 [Lentisphaerae bacterium ADurb.BinA184]|nr:MAG: hypothetical protein BWZ02_03123 [Lentisphaerae bacterium ADurb.BinA184]
MGTKKAKRAEKPATAGSAYDRLPKVAAGNGLPPVKRGKGRPKVLTEGTVKTTVPLYRRHMIALDQFCLDVRAASGAILDRSAVVRAAIEATLQAGIDPAAVQTEADVTAALLARLAGRRGK